MTWPATATFEDGLHPNFFYLVKLEFVSKLVWHTMERKYNFPNQKESLLLFATIPGSRWHRFQYWLIFLVQTLIAISPILDLEVFAHETNESRHFEHKRNPDLWDPNKLDTKASELMRNGCIPTDHGFGLWFL